MSGVKIARDIAAKVSFSTPLENPAALHSANNTVPCSTAHARNAVPEEPVDLKQNMPWVFTFLCSSRAACGIPLTAWLFVRLLYPAPIAALQSPLSKYLSEEGWPGAAVQSKEDLEKYVRTTACSGNALTGET